MDDKNVFRIKKIEIDITPPDVDGEVIIVFTNNEEGEKKGYLDDIEITLKKISNVDYYSDMSKKEKEDYDNYKGTVVTDIKDKEYFFSLFNHLTIKSEEMWDRKFPKVDLKGLRLVTASYFNWEDTSKIISKN